MSTETETLTKPVNSDVEVPASEAIVTDELSEVKEATQRLVTALQGLAKAKIKSAADLTEEAHQGIEQSVQSLRDKADQNWQATVHQVEDIDARLTKAAKVAWEVLTAPSLDDE